VEFSFSSVLYCDNRVRSKHQMKDKVIVPFKRSKQTIYDERDVNELSGSRDLWATRL
jgi:hypothetical protein